MLDLSVLKDKTYDIKLENGEVLHINKPTQRMMKTVIEMSEVMQTGIADLEKIDKLFDFVTTIFNYNRDDKKFKKAQMEDMFDIAVAMYIVQDYLKFTSNVLADPN